MSRMYNAPPPGTLTDRAQPLPLPGVPGVPGGTLMNPVPVPGTRSWGIAPTGPGGTGSVVSRDAVLQMTAINGRGAGPAGSRADEGLVYAGAKAPGVRSNASLLGAIARVDRRNPVVARHLLRSGMTAGATRIR